MADRVGKKSSRIEGDAYFRISELLRQYFLVGMLLVKGPVDFCIKLYGEEHQTKLKIQLKSTEHGRDDPYVTFNGNGMTFAEYATTCDVLIFTWQADQGESREKCALVPLRDAAPSEIGEGWPDRYHPPSVDSPAGERLLEPHFTIDLETFQEEFKVYMLDGTDRAGDRPHVWEGLAPRLKTLLERKEKAGHVAIENGEGVGPKGEKIGPESFAKWWQRPAAPAAARVTRSSAAKLPLPVASVELPVGKPRGKVAGPGRGNKRRHDESNHT